MAHAPTLYFIKMTGCSHCEAAEPEVRKLAKANPGLRVETRDTTKDKIPFPVPYVPAFVMVLPNGEAFFNDSLASHKASALAGWVREVVKHGRKR